MAAASPGGRPATVSAPNRQEWTNAGNPPDFLPLGNDFAATATMSRYEPTSLYRAFERFNQDVLAWIAGSPEHFTEQSARLRLRRNSDETSHRHQRSPPHDRRHGRRPRPTWRPADRRVLVACSESRRASNSDLPFSFPVPSGELRPARSSWRSLSTTARGSPTAWPCGSIAIGGVAAAGRSARLGSQGPDGQGAGRLGVHPRPASGGDSRQRPRALSSAARP